MNNSW